MWVCGCVFVNNNVDTFTLTHIHYVYTLMETNVPWRIVIESADWRACVEHKI